jgi:nucleotide-binding universal stress UspA family protein
MAKAAPIELAPLRFRIRKILVPIDFSEPSQQALRYARPFAEQFGASLTLLHVMEPVVYPAEFGYAPLAPLEAEEPRQNELQARLQQMGIGLGTTVSVKSIVRVGRVWKEIVDVAKAQDTDLIIVATHGYTGLKHALLGSVAEKVLRHAPCPALVVRTEEHDFL